MQYVAHQTTLQAEEVEILLVKGKHQSDENLPTKHPQIPMDELQILKGQETVAGLKASCSSSRDHLVSVILAGWQSSTDFARSCVQNYSAHLLALWFCRY
jgi:E3 ubiquitin-protein ligase RNF1/2